MAEQSYAYPAQPPDCIRVQSEQYGQPCEGCPYIPECGYLAVSRNRIYENMDKIVPGFYNLNGVEAIIQQDPALATDLVAGRAGLLQVDIRGVKFGNDVFGQYFGDALIREGGSRLSSDCIRSTETPYDERRRDWYPGKLDIGFRTGKSDELFALIRDINENELHAIAMRSQEHFSVERALQNCRQGDALPLPGNISYLHVTRISADQRTSALDAFTAMREMTSAIDIVSKSSQYDEMWTRVVSASGGNTQRPSDDRLIYQRFVEIFCPDISDRM
jgi:GGDEF domain-containing protein